MGGKAEALEEDRHFLESQIQLAKKHNGTLREQVEAAKTAAYKALVHGPPEQQEVAQAQAAIGEQVLASELESRYQQTVAHLRQRFKQERAQVAHLRHARANPWAETSELERHFLDCIQEAKEDIARRREGQRTHVLSNPKWRLEQQPTTAADIAFEDFMQSDKRAVISKLLSKEAVLLFLYGKLFPHKKVESAGGGAVLPVIGTSAGQIAAGK